MNNEQRKFLVEQVTNSTKEKISNLRSKIPAKPSLNNYIVAAFLDNSIEFNDINVLKEKIRNKVLKMGHSDVLISRPTGYRVSDLEDDTVKLNAHELFIIPKAYQVELEEYERIKKDIEDQIDKINAVKNTVIMKIQIGSSLVLDKLVMQVDNMGDLDVMNNQLMLKE